VFKHLIVVKKSTSIRVFAEYTPIFLHNTAKLHHHSAIWDLFAAYLKEGYYPFAKEPDFEVRLQQVINQPLEIDIPNYAEMSVSTRRKMKQLMAILSESVPFKPNVSKIAAMLNIGRNNIADYLLYMEEAGMIAQLTSKTSGVRAQGKVDKIYLENTNLMHQLSRENQNLGNLRETFFLNQTKTLHTVS